MTNDMIRQLEKTAAFIQHIYPYKPSVGIVLGSGIGNFAGEIEIEQQIEYSQIPDFPVSTVEGHSGRLIFGKLKGKRVMAMAGRFHYYEGYSVDQVVFPVRLMKFLGVHTLLLSNAAGGMQKDFKVGDLMIITDHISFFTVNPLIGPNLDALGPRFPDMSEPYRKSLVQKAREIALRLGITLKEGVYAGVTGPTFETHAEYRMLHQAGAQAVGMSTVQEAIAAVHMGLDVFAMSIITDMGIREEVLREAKLAEPKLTAIFKELIGAL
jgi:purine-nucleoside phosphorylase